MLLITLKLLFFLKERVVNLRFTLERIVLYRLSTVLFSDITIPGSFLRDNQGKSRARSVQRPTGTSHVIE